MNDLINYLIFIHDEFYYLIMVFNHDVCYLLYHVYPISH